MIKRLSIISILLGCGHILSIAALSTATKFSSLTVVGLIGIIESTYFLLESILGFGVQLAVTREIAVNDRWQAMYAKIQASRFSIGLIIAVIGFTVALVTENWIVLFWTIAPLIALNGIFGLYGMGKPVHASLLSFLVVAIPSTTIIVSALTVSKWVIPGFIVAFFFAVLVAGILAANWLKTPYFFRPTKEFLKPYIENCLLGSASIAFALQTFGTILIAKMFFSTETIGIIYPGIKLYIIYRGVRRLLIQAFFKNLTDDSFLLKIDTLLIVMAAGFLILTAFFPTTLTAILFNAESAPDPGFMICVAAAACVAAVAPSAATRLILEKHDKFYSAIMGLSATCIVLGTLVASYLGQIWGIPIAILVGEGIQTLSFSIKLGGVPHLIPRLLFIAKTTLGLAMPFGLRLWLGDTLPAMSMSVILFGFFFAIINFKTLTAMLKFRQPAFAQK